MGDEKATFWQGVDIAFGLQLLIGALYGDDGDVQMLRQSPLGGKTLPGGQGAVQDIRADAAVQVFVKGQSAPILQGIGQHGTASFLIL